MEAAKIQDRRRAVLAAGASSAKVADPDVEPPRAHRRTAGAFRHLRRFRRVSPRDHVAPAPVRALMGAARVTASPHDALVKRTFSVPANAAGEIRAVLPEALAARIDWESLALEPGSFVDDEGRERHTDLLFSAL